MNARELTIRTGGYDSHIVTWGDPSSEPVALLVHGSGPGSTAEGSWSWLVPALRERGLAVVAPDLAGFGWTQRVTGFDYSLDSWSDQLAAVLEGLGIERARVLGNSLGGAIALAFAIREPNRVERLATMGTVGIRHELRPALELIWGYEPSLAAMREMTLAMPADPGIVTEAMVLERYEASITPGWQESYRAMFPRPLQDRVDEMSLEPELLRRIDVPTLLLHGRDDPVVPVDTSLELVRLLPHASLRVYAGLGHWPSTELPGEYARELSAFLA